MYKQILLAMGLMLLSGTAAAYIGPGAGISFVGSIFAALAAFLVAILAILVWPIRYMFRRMRKNKGKDRATPTDEPQAEDV